MMTIGWPKFLHCGSGYVIFLIFTIYPECKWPWGLKFGSNSPKGKLWGGYFSILWVIIYDKEKSVPVGNVSNLKLYMKNTWPIRILFFLVKRYLEGNSCTFFIFKNQTQNYWNEFEFVDWIHRPGRLDLSIGK